jgi:hypothetical protein
MSDIAVELDSNTLDKSAIGHSRGFFSKYGLFVIFYFSATVANILFAMTG